MAYARSPARSPQLARTIVRRWATCPPIKIRAARPFGDALPDLAAAVQVQRTAIATLDHDLRAAGGGREEGPHEGRARPLRLRSATCSRRSRPVNVPIYDVDCRSKGRATQQIQDRLPHRRLLDARRGHPAAAAHGVIGSGWHAGCGRRWSSPSTTSSGCFNRLQRRRPDRPGRGSGPGGDPADRGGAQRPRRGERARRETSSCRRAQPDRGVRPGRSPSSCRPSRTSCARRSRASRATSSCSRTSSPTSSTELAGRDDGRDPPQPRASQRADHEPARPLACGGDRSSAWSRSTCGGVARGGRHGDIRLTAASRRHRSRSKTIQYRRARRHARRPQPAGPRRPQPGLQRGEVQQRR